MRAFSGLLVALTAAWVAGLAPAALADQHAPATAQAQCTADLAQSRDMLRGIQNDLQRDGVTDATLARLISWQGQYQQAVETAQATGTLGSAALKVGGGLAAVAFVGGPVGWATAGVALAGAIITGFVEQSYNTVLTIDNWANIDANTAFYQYLLDYAEFGRVGDVTDPALQRFLGDHRAALTRLTGTPPPDNAQTLHLYLQTHADALLLIYGYFEQHFGPDNFPRWKFSDTTGRFGPERMAVGYYRALLADRLAAQLARVEADIRLLEQTGCHGQDAAPAALAACGQHGPGAGNRRSCTCDLSLPGNVWGSAIYTDDSDICSAAVHAGVIGPIQRADGTYGYGGVVEVAGAPGCPSYHPSTARGVTSLAYGQWSGSVYFPSVQSGFCDPASRPPRNQWYCPRAIGSQTDLTCYCAPSEFDAGRIWGSGVYTDDSTICMAARHAGAVGASGGMVRVIELGPLDEYSATASNGIDSLGYGPWARSIGFP